MKKENICGKKLLFLGGSKKMCEFVEKAKSLGVYTVTADWYKSSPAKALSDEAYDISTSDVDALCALIAKKRINGVFTGFIDSVLPYYRELCIKSGLPCYLNEQTLEACTNKRAFKSICAQAGIPVIPSPLKDEYPRIIKPADNSGSKGITVCYDEDMLADAKEKAMRFSKTNDYLEEKFLICDYVAAYYTVKDGKAHLTMLMDKDMNRIGRGNVPFPAAFVSPSAHYKQYTAETHPLVQRLVDLLEYKNGTFLISFFVSGKRFYAIEMTARLTATREHVFIADAANIDMPAIQIRQAITGSFDVPDNISTVAEIINKNHYVMMFLNSKEGVIEKIEGLEQVRSMESVLGCLQLREVGNKIRADGSYGQLFARIHLKGSNVDSLIDSVERIESQLRLYDTSGNSMLIAGFDARRFFSYIKYPTD